MIQFKVKKLSPSAKLPTKNNPDDAGIDIYSDETSSLAPGETRAFSTGISVEIPIGYVSLLWDRSSMGAKSIHRLAGVIDAGYRGEWKVLLVNLSKEPYVIQKGDKIAQCLVQAVEPTEISESSDLSVTARAEKGFGSSGR